MNIPTLAQVDIEEKPYTSHVEVANEAHNDGDIKGDLTLNEAMEAEAIEHSMGIIEALRTYPWAVFWSISVSMCVVSEAYDNALINTLFGLSAFKKQFGVYLPASQKYTLTAPWQSALSQSSAIGCFIGIIFTGWISEKIGYRKTAILGQFLMIAAIFLTFFADRLWILLLGEIACGFPWGMFINLAPAYASEVAPLPLRGFLTVYVQLCWCIGQFIAAGVLYSVNTRTDKWAYKIPFAVQWAWPLPLIFLLIFAPESPWWLVRKGRLAEAEKVVRRLGGKIDQDPKNTVAMMVRTNEIEIANETGVSFKDCFKGVDRRRTLIVCMIFGMQPLSGLTLGNQFVFFSEQAGLDSSNAFKMNLGNNAIAFLGTIFSWFLISWFGRRTIYLGGLMFAMADLYIIAFIGIAKSSSGVNWATSGLMIAYNFIYDAAIGPLTYAIISEMSSVRLRSKSIGLARNTYYITHIIAGITTPYMINSTAGNLKGKAGFIWGTMAVFCFVLAFFHLPETKGRNYRELDLLFHRKTPARKFASTNIEEVAEE
ncbi:uncharacterized protein IL334_002050 [Kwoniella shivajii]|uniref:Major facilitator superfamily (MFS) profile domain-containing protein n=1 Tax=Kwoniella shivajii TaxID=564305 RepID=A0ABZ1CTM4_9TREE|nr:hypothetical protein IL334_002050 [Kwoniella shivajii]